jgi:hypothetical protein
MAKKKTTTPTVTKSGGIVKKGNYLILGDHSYKIAWLKSVTESKAIEILKAIGRDTNQIKNAHKRANGLSVRNEDK